MSQNFLTFQQKQKTEVQPKLQVNLPGDRFEQEADDMAERVMTMPLNETPIKPIAGIIGASLHRKCTSCVEENKKKMPIMRKAENLNNGIQASLSLVSSLNATKGGGSPLPKGTRSYMENAFSADFSRVRIHADSYAYEMNDKINAKAFTHGSDIYFNQGNFNITSREGSHLLAHELTHTLQQSGKIQRQSGTTTTVAQPTAQDRTEFAAMQDRFFSEQGEMMVNQILHSAGFAEGLRPATPADAERIITFWGLSMSGIVSQMSQIAASFSTRVSGQTTSANLLQQQQNFIAALSPAARQVYQHAVQLVRNEPFWQSYFANNEVYIFPDLQGGNRFSGYNQAVNDPNDATGQRKIIIVHISALHLENNFPEISAATIIHELSHVIYEPSVLDRALSSFRSSLTDLLLEHPQIIATRTGAADPALAREQQRQRISQILYETVAYGEEEIFVHLQQLTHQPDVSITHANGTVESLRGGQLIQHEVLRYVRRLRRIGLETHMLQGVVRQIGRRVALMFDRRIGALPAGSAQRQIMEANKSMAQILFDMALRDEEL